MTSVSDAHTYQMVLLLNTPSRSMQHDDFRKSRYFTVLFRNFNFMDVIVFLQETKGPGLVGSFLNLRTIFLPKVSEGFPYVFNAGFLELI